MQRVALVICPPFWLKTPSLGLEYLKAFLEKPGVNIDLYDLNMYFYRLFEASNKTWLKLNRDFENNLYNLAENKFPTHLKNIADKLNRYDFVGFSLFSRNEQFSFELAKKLNKTPSTRIIFGGPQVRQLQPESFPSESIVVKGEGEIPLSRIINQGTESSLPYEELDDLDGLPFINFKGFDLKLYKPIRPLLTSRGCIKRCKFCAEWALYKKFRQHSVNYTADQIEYLLKLYKISNFSFQDSLINASLEWLENFCGRIIKKRLHINWEAQIIIRKDMGINLMRLMKKSGCVNLFIGLESGSDRIIKTMNKGFSIEDAYKFFNNLNNAGLLFEVSLIIGYPGESNEDFKETMGFLKNNRNIIKRIAQVSGFVPYKNSIIYNEKPDYLAACEINRRLRKITNLIEKEKIPHKKAFIDNLRYGNTYADNN